MNVVQRRTTWYTTSYTSSHHPDLLSGAEVRVAASDRRIPGPSPADRSFWENLAKSADNDLSARLEPGILRSDTAALTSAPASHERTTSYSVQRPKLVQHVVRRRTTRCSTTKPVGAAVR